MRTIKYLDIVADYDCLPSNMTNLPLAEKMVKEFKKRMGVEKTRFCNEAGFKSIISNLLAEYDQRKIEMLISSTGHGLEFLSLQVRL